ncbi:MAG: HEAT repeat domain-containing protein [Candidatus Hydrogenedentes bacterium]|nr:HEAT repeat domain-containing protein [Candidatus Hydrogenedentota bacterium]
MVPRLIDLAEDSTLETSGRERALNWLGWTHDPDAEEFLLSFAKKLADPGHPKWRIQDETLYIAAVIGLGFCDTDTAADYLFEAIRPEYWQARADVVPTEWLSNVRSGIAMSVALSGAERADQARSMNKGVPEDFRAELQREGMPELIQRWKAFRDAHPRPYPGSQKPAATSSGQPSGRYEFGGGWDTVRRMWCLFHCFDRADSICLAEELISNEQVDAEVLYLH